MSRDFKREGDLQRDQLLSMIVGDRIGGGSYRRVYEHVGDPSLVIKVEYSGYSGWTGTPSNVSEMNTWLAVENTPLRDWFAPCVAMDQFGIILFQKRAMVFETEAQFRAALKMTGQGAIPEFFDDVGHGNFGMLEDRVVCLDYAFNHFLQQGVRQYYTVNDNTLGVVRGESLVLDADAFLGTAAPYANEPVACDPVEDCPVCEPDNWAVCEAAPIAVDDDYYGTAVPDEVPPTSHDWAVPAPYIDES